jgi:hypothetical protein
LPGLSKPKRYAPVLFELVFCVPPVSLFFRVTIAVGTAAPLGSVIVPVTLPVVRDWANEVAGSSNTPATTTINGRNRERACDFIREISSGSEQLEEGADTKNLETLYLKNN